MLELQCVQYHLVRTSGIKNISVKIIPVYKSHLFIKQWNFLYLQAGAVANARATVCSVPSGALMKTSVCQKS